MYVGMLMLLFVGLFVVAVPVLVVIWIVRMADSPREWPHLDDRWQPPQGDRSFDIVRERYARGDITLDEYHDYCRNLERCGGI